MAESALENIADRVREAATNGIPLCIRGGGTKDFYGLRPAGDLLDTTALSGIMSHEPSELVVTASAGTPLAELEARLAEHGQQLAFEPPHFGPATTVGGMVAAGLAGPARASAGGVRDHVLGVQLINGKGELLTYGGQVMKNVAGYDVSRLMAGSMGTLGIITQVSLKVVPVAPAECTLMFKLSETSARQQLNRWGGQPLPLNASCWADGWLAVRMRGARAAVEAARKTMGGDLLDSEQATEQWSALRNQRLPFFELEPGQALWRVSVPDTAAPLGLGATLIEWHGALRWLHLPLSAAERIRNAAARIGGHATLFRGSDGTVPVFDQQSATLMRLQQRLKQAFDPAGILNRGRLRPEF